MNPRRPFKNELGAPSTRSATDHWDPLGPATGANKGTRHRPSHELGGKPKRALRAEQRTSRTNALQRRLRTVHHDNPPTPLACSECRRSRNSTLAQIRHCPKSGILPANSSPARGVIPGRVATRNRAPELCRPTSAHSPRRQAPARPQCGGFAGQHSVLTTVVRTNALPNPDPGKPLRLREARPASVDRLVQISGTPERILLHIPGRFGLSLSQWPRTGPCMTGHV